MSLPPDLPSPQARIRRVSLKRAGSSVGRPAWAVGDARLPIEPAIGAWLAGWGRDAIHAENWLWTSLFALVFRDLYFLPVPGMLPTPRRAGPLDLGTPAFARNRSEAVDARLRRVEAEGVRAAVAGWSGEQLAGLVDAPEVHRWVDRVPAAMARVILGRLAWEGWPAARGLPDLFVAEGAPIRLDGAIPPMLPDSAFLVELKGPGDQIRSYQMTWHARLCEGGIPVELWIVSG